MAQVVDCGNAVSKVPERRGISTKSLYTWKGQFLKPQPVPAEVLDQAAQIRRLKRELARATEERTTLKKATLKRATAYFARESQLGVTDAPDFIDLYQVDVDQGGIGCC